jgi:hypothetical protein
VSQLPGLGRVRVDGHDRAADSGERAAVEVADLGALDRQDRVRALGQHLRRVPRALSARRPRPRFRVGIGCLPWAKHPHARPAAQRAPPWPHMSSPHASRRAAAVRSRAEPHRRSKGSAPGSTDATPLAKVVYEQSQRYLPCSARTGAAPPALRCTPIRYALRFRRMAASAAEIVYRLTLYGRAGGAPPPAGRPARRSRRPRT